MGNTIVQLRSPHFVLAEWWQLYVARFYPSDDFGSKF
jgi:hypothetical protein